MSFRVGHFICGLLCLVMFALGLLGSCWAIRAALPFPEVPMVRPKIEHLAQQGDAYDTLFLGSSRIYYQIIPAIFDRLAAEQGLPARSYNAGIAGMRPPEDAYYLDTILRHPPKRLRWVFIELAGLRPAVDPDKVGTARAVYWHDWPRLRLLFERALWVKPDTKKKKWMRTFKNRLEPFADFVDHLPLFVQWQTNLGRGSLLTARLISKPSRPTNPVAHGGDLRGWNATGRPEMMSSLQQTGYEKALGERRVEEAQRDPADPVSQRALETMIARIEQLGATPILLVPPTTNKRNFVPLPERERKTIVLDFCDLEKFPELYEARYRLDTDHLNTEGSKLFTRILVETWAAEVRRRWP